MSHFGALVPHSLFDKLSHCTHVKTLESGKIDAELCISVLTKEPANFCEFISHTDIKRLLVRLVPQDHSTWSYCHSFVVHCPTNLSNILLVC